MYKEGNGLYNPIYREAWAVLLGDTANVHS